MPDELSTRYEPKAIEQNWYQFWEKGDFTKLREVAITFTAPQNWMRRGLFRADRLSMTLAGRNLGTWTKFTGIDPELSTNPGGTGVDTEVQDPFQAVPPPRLYTIRFNLGF